MRYPFIGAKNHGGPQSTSNLHRIVIHSTVTPCDVGWARKVAGWFHTWNKNASAHYVVDPKTIIKCLHDNVIGYHAPPNAGSIGIEMCDMSGHKDGSIWLRGDHLPMLELVAGLVAQKCKAYNIPVQWLSVDDLRSGKRGITAHLNVSLAWHQTTHTDPGSTFPHDKFIDMVKDAMGGGTKEPTKPSSSDTPKYPGYLLKVGVTNNSNVKLVQKRLNDLAVHADRLAVDGDYGPNTRGRVKGFQGNHNLKKDGIVGPNTWKALF